MIDVWGRHPWSPQQDAAWGLVATILSQNTNWQNTRRALSSLQQRCRTAADLLSLSVKELERLIRPAGLWRIKAKRIRAALQVLIPRFGPHLERLHEVPPTVARQILLEAPGVGPKTADVLLAFYAGAPIIPIDTHIARITRRLGLAAPSASYEQIRSALEKLIPPKHRLRAHIALIRFGREVCRSRNPRCAKCPLRSFCKYARSRKGSLNH